MTEFIFLMIGFLSGAFIMWISNNSKSKNLENQLLKEKELKIKAEAQLNAQKSYYEQSNKHIKETFESLAGNVLQNSNQSFIQLAQQTFDKYLTKANDDLDKRKVSIENLVKPLKETLDKHEMLVNNFQTKNATIFGNFQTYLDELNKNQKSLEKETNALVTALKAPKVRGRWGEIGLKRIVEFSGMNDFCDFTEQSSISSDDGRLRPDMIIMLPDNKKIVIDSKVPLNSYLESIESESDEIKSVLLAKHSKAVQQHVKNLSSKSYWSQFDDSVDFVVLYIEVESAFGAALSENPNLILESIQNRIVFATPSTLITLLQTVAYSWKQHKATENAFQIWQATKELYERLATFTEYYHKIGNEIQDLVKIYNQSIGSWENRIIPSIKKIENLGVKSEKKTICEPSEIELSTRKIESSSL